MTHCAIKLLSWPTTSRLPIAIGETGDVPVAVTQLIIQDPGPSGGAMDRRNVVTVVVIDDHPAVVAGVRSWCSQAQPLIHVVASGPKVDTALTDPGRCADVVVFDLQRADSSLAYAELRHLVTAGRPVIVYTTRKDQKIALACLEIGVFTYLTKAESSTYLLSAIKAAAAKQPFITRSMSDRARAHRPRLSNRETEVLLEWLRGESKQTVADRLGLSASTVSGYIDRIRIKYANVGRAAPTKAALIARALQDGLVQLNEL